MFPNTMAIFPAGVIGVVTDSRWGNEGYARVNEGVLVISEDFNHVPIVGDPPVSGSRRN